MSELPKEDRALTLPYHQSVANYFRLNEILNLAFKFNVDLGAEEFQQFKGISAYYDWLLDMDQFDYLKFDPTWILANRTESYLQKIFANKKVVDYMKKYLPKAKHPVLSELFIRHS